MGKTKRYKGKFLTFHQARKIARKLGLKSKREWEQLKDRPKNIPFNPHVPYKEYGWTSYPDFLNYKPYKPIEKFLPFEQARKFVRSLGFKKAKADWVQYSRSGKRPENIPSTPKVVYKEKYKGLRNWVGLPEKSFLPFTKARKKARALGLKGVREWRDFCNSKDRPLDIPVCPRVTYKECGWINFPDFLGYKYPRFLPFEQAREFVRSLGLKKTKEWEKYSSSGKRPRNIPSCPNVIYKKEFKGFRDWIGLPEKIFLPFAEARKYVRKNMTGRDWWEWCRDNRPSNIPIKPDVIYKNKGWKSWVDWFGKRKPKFLPYKKAKALARTLGIKGSEEWHLLSKQKKRPKEIPACPQHYYKEFVSYADFFGYKRCLT